MASRRRTATRTGPTASRTAPRRRSRLGRWWLDAPLRTKGLMVLAPPLLALVAMGVANLVLTSQIDNLIATTSATTTSGTQIDEQLQLATEAETGIRGYAATGNPVFLKPYERAIARLASLDTPGRVIDGLTAAQSEELRRLGTIAFQKLAAIRTGVADHTFTPAELDAELLAGMTAENRLSAAIDADRAGQQATLAAQQRKLVSTEAVVRRVDRLALLLGVLSGILAMVLFLRTLARRVSEVGENTERFLRDEPMEFLEPSEDEIGVLQRDLQAAAGLLADREGQLQRAHDEAVAATRAKDEFLSRMSHELRTPLTAVLGFGQLLQLEELAPRDAESVDNIVGAGQHLLTLINDILDIARIETGDISLSMEAILLGNAVADAVALMAPLAQSAGVGVEVGDMEDVVVRADRQRLKQVLLNLLSNAVKYNREGGTVTVSCARRAHGRVALSVADTGVGIPASAMGLLFEPFERLGAEASGVEGTGVGLSLCKALMEAMDGTIAAASQQGEGSTFTLTLGPGELTQRLGTDMPPGGRPPGPAGIVLYAEDNLASLRVVERVFAGRRETLQVAHKGTLILELAREIRPRLVILDLHLPDMDGEEVLRRLKADPATAAVPVVILSADATPGRLERLVDQGAEAYLTKPLVLTDLLAILDGQADGD